MCKKKKNTENYILINIDFNFTNDESRKRISCINMNYITTFMQLKFSIFYTLIPHIYKVSFYNPYTNSNFLLHPCLGLKKGGVVLINRDPP